MANSSRLLARVGPRRLGFRGLAALLLTLALLISGAACGFGVQTNRPYTPAEGVNEDIGDPPVLVRNLKVLSREDGVGFISGTLIADERDTLVGVSGAPIKLDDSAGAPFKVTQPQPIELGTGAIVILTQQPIITVTSPDLIVGAAAELTLQLANAGEHTIETTIVDADQQAYRTISPSPAATPSS